MAPITHKTPEEVQADLEAKGGLLLNQPATEFEITGEQLAQLAAQHLTFVDLTGLAFSKASAYQQQSDGPAGREYAIAKTHLEEAVMRFNRARSMELGCFHIADTESDEFLSYVSTAKLDEQTPAEKPQEEGGDSE